MDINKEELRSEALNSFSHEPDTDTWKESENKKSKAVHLVIGVPTQWNSTYLILLPLICFKNACKAFCKHYSAVQFALNDLEWDVVKQMCSFLQTLSEATNTLRKTQFPKFHQVIPVYIVVLKGLKKVERTYDQD